MKAISSPKQYLSQLKQLLKVDRPHKVRQTTLHEVTVQAQYRDQYTNLTVLKLEKR